MPALLSLSPRLAGVAELVLPDAPMADIGTDHGYLPVFLVQSGRVPLAIASDRLPGPVAAARRTVSEYGAAGRVEVRLADGLAALQPGEVATVVLAGMGGPLMQEILSARPELLAGVRRLVLQPNTGEEGLRRWLVRQGWRLVAERLVADAGRLYVILAAEPGAGGCEPEGPGAGAAEPGEPGGWTEADWVVGPLLRREGGPLLAAYLRVERERTRRALAGAERARCPDLKRIEGLRERLWLFDRELARLQGGPGAGGGNGP